MPLTPSSYTHTEQTSPQKKHKHTHALARVPTHAHTFVVALYFLLSAPATAGSSTLGVTCRPPRAPLLPTPPLADNHLQGETFRVEAGGITPTPGSQPQWRHSVEKPCNDIIIVGRLCNRPPPPTLSQQTTPTHLCVSPPGAKNNCAAPNTVALYPASMWRSVLTCCVLGDANSPSCGVKGRSCLCINIESDS